MDVRRIRNGLRRALFVERNATTGPARALGLQAAHSTGGADQRGFSARVLADRPVSACVFPPGRVHTPEPLSPASQATPRGLFHPGPVKVLNACGAPTEPARRAAKRPGGVFPQSPLSTHSYGYDNGSQGTSRAAGLRNVPPHGFWRASWRRDIQCLEPARCCNCDLRFAFPLSSQHLPFPSRNARVEVGRTVMEG